MLELFRQIFAPPRDLIMLVAAGWLGIALAEKRARASATSEKALDGLIAWFSVAFLLGGRLLFLLSHMQAFVSSPLSIFSLNVGLFDPWGGLACAAIVLAILLQRKNPPAWQTLDLLTPFFACIAIGLGLSHLASGAAFGRETNLPWAINLWGASRHPTQIYETIAASLALGIIWLRRADPRPGTTFFLWVALEAASRVAIEGFRGDSTLVFGGLRLAQIIAWVVLAVALIALELLQQPSATQEAPPPLPVEPDAAALPQPEPKQKRTAPRKSSAHSSSK